MKVKLGELVSSTMADERGTSAFQRFTKLDFPAVTSYRLQLLADQIEPKIEAFDEVRIKQLVPKYGTQIEGTTQYKIEGKNTTKYNQEVKQLLEEEVEIEIEQIKFTDIENYTISAWDLRLLKWLIVH